jgi:hypothetical protein
MSTKKRLQIKSLKSNEATILLELIMVELGNSQHYDVALSRKSNQYLILNGGFQPIEWLKFLQVSVKHSNNFEQTTMLSAINVAQSSISLLGKWNGINYLDIFYKSPGVQ